MNASGGLRWHLRACCSQTRWQGTCRRIQQWLALARPADPELLIIGASAGWMMPSSWLQNFSKVSTFDIDPLAAPLFRWRHGRSLQAAGSQLHCHTADALGQLDTVLRAHPRATVLLDNVLGQLRFVHATLAQASAQIEKVIHALRHRHWGSLHDAYSGAIKPASARALQASEPFLAQAAMPSTRPEIDQLPPELAHFSRQLNAQGEWLDHLTAGVFPTGTLVHHMAWPFSRGYCHWLQAGWVAR